MLLLLCYGKLLIALIQTHTLSLYLCVNFSVSAVFFLTSPFHFDFVCRVSNNSTHTFSGFQFNTVCPFFFPFFSFCCFRLFFGLLYFWYIMIAPEFVAFIFSILITLDLRYPTWYHMRSSLWNLSQDISYKKFNKTYWQRNIVDLM